MNKTIRVLILVAFITSAGGYLYSQNTHDSDSTMFMAAEATGFGNGHQVTVFKDPNCGCCTGYAEALRREGFTVKIENESDMQTIKRAHNIPPEGESCHTSIIDDYVVEGHVPLEAVEKLITEQPAIAGIGLPYMPAGTPGMPGIKRDPYEIYQIDGLGQVDSYLTL